MEQNNPLEALQILQQDLIALLNSRLSNVNRLEEELNARLEDFQKLLERNRRNEQSRKSIREAPADKSNPYHGTVITVDGLEYAISEDFKNAIYTVADEVDLDEIDAARLCLAVQEEVDTADETLPFRAVLRFHNQRQTLLECLRLIFKRVAEGDKSDEDYILEYFQNVAGQIMQRKSAQAISFWERCCDGLKEIEDMVKKTHDQMAAMQMTGQSMTGAHGEVLQAQRMFLAHQHECLASIMCYMIRSQHTTIDDFRRLILKTSEIDTHLDIISHYAPPIIAGATHYGAGNVIEDSVALDIHKMFAPGPAQAKWKRPDFQAAITIWWIVEYSARHADPSLAAEGAKARLEAATRRQELFFECLAQKGFHFMLAIADFLRPEVWHDPAKAGLVRFLMDNSVQFQQEAVAPSADFARLTMEQYQNFTEAFISYMPDVLRQLKSEEDEKRRNLIPSGEGMYEMHLERFLLIVAYAYQDDDDAAMEFWSDTESNLYGFLRWTSKRLPTPRVAAFCEVMRALANEERTANHAHRFLLEEGGSAPGRTRKAYSVSWAQIFSELELYAASFQNRPAVLSASNTPTMNKLNDPDVAEAETPIMLEAYLRLAAHVIGNSREARQWILREQPFRLHETLLQLAQSNTLPAVQACCFNVLAALLTDRSTDINDGVWLALDNWISGGGATVDAAQAVPMKTVRVAEKDYLQRIAADGEVATAFVNLLNALIVPLVGSTDLALDALPFPEQMAVSSRRSGIDVYVDFVFNQAFLSSSDPATVGDRMQMSVLRHACLTFAQLCLQTFNDDLIDMVKSRAAETLTTKLRPFEQYSRLHPFTRTIEYMFNDRVFAVLLDTARQNPDELETLTSQSPLVQAAWKAIEVMNLVMVKQLIYFDVIRPALTTQLTRRGGSVANPAVSSFDDIITSHLNITLYLIDYAACNHIDLVLASLQLLGRMSSSTKIIGFSEGYSGARDGHRLISKLQNYSEAIQVDLRQTFVLRIADLEDDTPPALYIKAKAILALLDASLSNPERPSIAHALLGFQCNATSVAVAPGTLFAEGKSLFHHIAEAAISLPPDFAGNHLPWLQTLRGGCVKLLTVLASASLTGNIVLDELRSMDYLAALQATAVPVAQSSLWDGVQAADPSLLLSEGTQTLLAFLAEREHIFEYAAKELQATSTIGIASALERVISTLSGHIDSGDRVESISSVFNLFDFFDLNITHPLDASLKYLGDIDASSLPIKNGTYNIQSTRQLLTLKKRELWQNGTIKDQNEEQLVNDEIAALLTSLESQNRYSELLAARSSALESWTDLLSSLTEHDGKPSLAQQALQIVIPRLDLAFREDVESAAQLAKLTLVLVRVLSRPTTASEGAVLRSASDQLIQVFRSCVRATADSDIDLGLRDVCYRINCLVISTLLSSNLESSAKQRQQLVSHIHDTGDRIVRVVAEDAFSGRGVTRISALLFLDTIMKMSGEGGRSSNALRSLSKVNFVPVLIDASIGSVAATFRTTDVEAGSSLAYFHTATALLLRIAQLPDGPQLILRSNFISAVEDSGLFSTDPDIGLDIDNPEALQAFYRLLSAIIRILVAIVVRRGPGDGSVIRIARKFLSDNRMSISSIFKLTSKQSSTRSEDSSDAIDVANELGRLILVTGFLEEDEAATSTTNGYQFS
ncbi:hypothetical protein AMS68_000196 [Peltaster fructicola]|uniref:Nucleoporin Nup186/Nup192/Nup205 n=1 Tax=Peltaster fructicola TaxID=286661 RepID=A0A6H0XJ66_9PEZI|nr:hypothetical protein AMS68_000196 [Peltaster fructicola]